MPPGPAAAEKALRCRENRLLDAENEYFGREKRLY